MSMRQSVYYPVLVPRNRFPTTVGAAPLAPRLTQPFRFFDLPFEIRCYIFELWIPSFLHVTTGFGKVRLQYFTETQQGLLFGTFSIRPFFLSRMFYQEFWYAVFIRSTWSFSYPGLLLTAFRTLSKSTVDGIRHVSIRLGEYSKLSPSGSTGTCEDCSTVSAFGRARQILRNMKQLQTLLIYLHLSDFGYVLARPPTAITASTLAANCVADFTWGGLKTRVPFAKSVLTKEFLRTLKLRCGEANVSLVAKAEDRYAGPMVDVVISQRAVLGS